MNVLVVGCRFGKQRVSTRNQKRWMDTLHELLTPCVEHVKTMKTNTDFYSSIHAILPWIQKNKETEISKLCLNLCNKNSRKGQNLIQKIINNKCFSKFKLTSKLNKIDSARNYENHSFSFLGFPRSILGFSFKVGNGAVKKL